MQTGAAKAGAVRAMFTKIVDYAGLFPPAQLAMPEAVAEYDAARHGTHAWMLGRFIVPVSRAQEMLTMLPDGEPFAVSVILDAVPQGLAQAAKLQSSDALRVQALEIVLEPDQIDDFARAAKDAGFGDTPSYVELRRDLWERDTQRAMPALAAAGLGAKVRCGGADASAFPAPAQLAKFIYSASRCSVPFKATAGLHHPIRHVDTATGAHMNGFLNLLAASAMARAGADREELVEPLACEDGAQFQFDDRGFRFNGHRVDVPEIEAMRREGFVSYGSCSFSEPVADLRAMNLL